ncbi:hypothetical protein DFP72DRAFT_853937 [Ephemerocybe angulata]|uniref:Gag-like protein n=1 Tax=Ephemerocybe angulata TaxID=980116 RepID=A0A8H6LYU2_9AGAR|nr:hypothetical protein DFP72DRAFT_853937 [Tulosesus angulatus]
MAKQAQSNSGGPATGTRSTATPATKEDALAALRGAKVIAEDHEASSLTKLAEALQRHAQKAKPAGQQQIQHFAEGMETTQEFFRIELQAAKEDIREMIRSGLADFKQHADHTSSSVMDIAKEVHSTLTSQNTATRPTYSSIVASGHPTGVDARTLARHSIQARQIMLDQESSSKLSDQPDGAQAKAIIQNALDEMGAPPDVKVRNVVWAKETGTNRRRSILLEMATDAAAAWLRAGERLRRFSDELGVRVRDGSHKVIGKFFPVSFDPDSHLDELCDANDISRDDIASVKWLKPTKHRKDTQATAHIVIDFKTPEAANEAITRGLAVAGRRLEVTKLKREPTCCHKCYKYGHIAIHCKNDKESCGRCGDETHPTRDCRNPEPRAYGTGANDIPVPALERAKSQRAAKNARKEKARETAAAKEAGVRFSNSVQCRLIGSSQEASQSNPVIQPERNANDAGPSDWSAE